MQIVPQPNRLQVPVHNPIVTVTDDAGRKHYILLPCPIEALPTIPFRVNGCGRKRIHQGYTRPEWMVLLGLSPSSSWPRCELCYHHARYMRKHGIDWTDPVIVKGRYLVHPRCFELEGQYLATLQLPALDYRLVVMEDQDNRASTLLYRMRAVIMSGRREGRA